MAKEQSTFAARQSVEVVVRAQSDERLQMGGCETWTSPVSGGNGGRELATGALRGSRPACGEWCLPRIARLMRPMSRDLLSKTAVLRIGPAASGCRWPAFVESQELRADRPDDELADDVLSRASGEFQVRARSAGMSWFRLGSGTRHAADARFGALGLHQKRAVAELAERPGRNRQSRAADRTPRCSDRGIMGRATTDRKQRGVFHFDCLPNTTRATVRKGTIRYTASAK